jgi:hypothetical protein
MLRISQSRIKTWRRCRKQYDYKHVQKLEPRRIARPLVFGRAVHKMIENQLQGLSAAEAAAEINKDRKGIFTADEEDWDTIIADATDIMQAYHDFWKNDPLDYVKIDGRKAEHKFEMPLAKDTVLTGVVDIFPKTADGRIWIGEHKSHKQQTPTEDVRMRDLQAMIYAHVAKEYYKIKRVSGVMWDYIRSKTPAVPALLKNGTLSKARIDTLPHVYEREINNQGLDRKDYVDILGDLDDKLPTWFRRVFLPLNQGAVDQLMEETVITAREIKVKAGVDTTRNVSRDCSWCSYERLCQAELFGMDADFIRSREYRERQDNEKPVEIDAEE